MEEMTLFLKIMLVALGDWADLMAQVGITLEFVFGLGFRKEVRIKL